ncbi:MAG: CRISPR-associated Cse3 family protein [Puniceicoccaceae bacterium 5H]|nr:MAG: CRISPR-associated Cse3 family protein [Puniceicoccaceae bacterium 5H]
MSTPSMNYLAKIEIDYELAYKQGILNSYAWHQKAWKAFPGRDGEARNFLTRVDEIDGGFRLLLLAPVQPTRPSWCPENGWACKEVPNAFFQRSSYRFSLVANPTVKKRARANGEPLKNSRRAPITSRKELLAWLERKGSQHGFEVDCRTLQTLPRPRQIFLKKGTAGLHAAVEFRGTLQVRQPEAFLQAARQGIGPAKAFGFGMLCLVPTA